jgi:hypothetical protein
MMQGKRVYAQGKDFWLKPGEYGKNPVDGTWYSVTPNGHWGNLSNHGVTEHEDGTITVSPSILVTSYDDEENKKTTWHGYLERGVWREV